MLLSLKCYLFCIQHTLIYHFSVFWCLYFWFRWRALFTQKESWERGNQREGQEKQLYREEKTWQSKIKGLFRQTASPIWFPCGFIFMCVFVPVCDLCNHSLLLLKHKRWHLETNLQHSTFWALINMVLHSTPSFLSPIHVLLLLPPPSDCLSTYFLLFTLFCHCFTAHPSIHPSSLPHSHTSSSVPPLPAAPSSATSPCLHFFSSSHNISHFFPIHSLFELKPEVDRLVNWMMMMNV